MLFRLALACVVLVSLVPFFARGKRPCGVVRPPPSAHPACCALFVFLWLWCVMLCGAAVCCVLCVLRGAVWRACVGLGSCALLSAVVLCWVLMCYLCCVLLSRVAVLSACFFFPFSLPFCGAPGCFCPCCALQAMVIEVTTSDIAP